MAVLRGMRGVALVRSLAAGAPGRIGSVRFRSDATAIPYVDGSIATLGTISPTLTFLGLAPVLFITINFC